MKLRKCEYKICNNFFSATSTQNRKKYCDAKCRDHAFYYNNVERMREKARLWHHKSDDLKNKSRIAACELDGCANFFSATPRQHSKVFCSNKCKDENYRDVNREKLRKRSREWQSAKRASDPEYAERHRQRSRASWRKMYYSLTPEEKLRINRRKYAQVNVENRRKKARETKRERYHKDLNFRLSSILRSRISRSLRDNNIHYKKSNHSIDLLGCSIVELKAHLEAKFTDGMSWDNYGEWHVDHIKPCASFENLGTCPKQQRECFHYSNLQPLWAEDNRQKYSSV